MNLISNITAYSRTIPAINAVILFGSAAVNRLHKASDIDLALHFGFGNIPSPGTLEQIQIDIEQITKRDVDLIVLDTASTILAFQIIKTGELLFYRDEQLYQRYVMHLISEYADFKIIRRPIEEAVRTRRIL